MGRGGGLCWKKASSYYTPVQTLPILLLVN